MKAIGLRELAGQEGVEPSGMLTDENYTASTQDSKNEKV
jgi:hypothetical protein